VTDDSAGPYDQDELDRGPFAIDTTVAHPARIQNYLAGGDGHFAVDRHAVEHFGSALPGGVADARASIRSLAGFMARTVTYASVELGIRQFLNIGATVPTVKKVHEVARQVAPDSRFVYVGDDPVVLAHAHELRARTDEGATDYVHATIRDTEVILEQSAPTIDFAMPVAVLLVTTLNFVPDDEGPYRLLADLVDALAPGSCVTIAHASYDLKAEGMREASVKLAEALKHAWVVRTHTEIGRFFDGLDMIEPGLVPVDEWHPSENARLPRSSRPVPIFGGVGIKP
jgi:S-adenosyl methyltransferase